MAIRDDRTGDHEFGHRRALRKLGRDLIDAMSAPPDPVLNQRGQ